MRDSDVRYYRVDAFTDTPFGGDPCAVFLMDEILDPRAMQILAREANVTESAFVGPAREDGSRPVRWFTPTVEIAVSGHASLAAGHVLIRELGESDPVVLEATAGPLEVSVVESGLSMELPADPPEIALPPAGLLEALGCHDAVPVLRAARVWLVRLTSQDEVEELAPSVPRLLEVDLGDDTLGVCVTAPGSADADFVSRFFGPWVGVPEEPVTGVAHTVLAPYWAEQLGRKSLLGRQLSTRLGTVRVTLDDDRVAMSGEFVTVARGSFLHPEV